MQNRSRFIKRDFSDRINFSLNTFVPKRETNQNQLRLRTLKEMNLNTLYDNPMAQKFIRDSSNQTTIEDPFLRISAFTHRQTLINRLVNELSRFSAYSFISRELGAVVRSDKFICALICSPMHTLRSEKKIRLLIMREELLLKAAEIETPALEKPWHDRRWHTILKMSEMHKNRQDYEDAVMFEIELCSRVHPSRYSGGIFEGTPVEVQDSRCPEVIAQEHLHETQVL